MKIEVPAQIPDKKIDKLINKNNKYIKKGKNSKAEAILKDILKCSFDILIQDPKPATDKANIFIYIISLIVEEHPDLLDKNKINIIQDYLTSARTIKEQINAIAILGFQLMYEIEEKSYEDFNFQNLEVIMELLNRKEAEIRHNVWVFLERLPKDDYLLNYYLSRIDFFLHNLEVEDVLDNLRNLVQILSLLQKRLSLKGLISYIFQLSRIYYESNWPQKNESIRKLLELEIPSLKKVKSDTPKKDILQSIENRKPLARKYNLNKMADEYDMDFEVVRENLMAEIDEKITYAFEYSHKHKNYIIEFEKEPLIRYFNDKNNKVRIEQIFEDFEPLGITNTGILSILVKGLVKNYLISGYLSKMFWYPYEFLYSHIKKELTQKGHIVIKKYVELLNEKYFKKILSDITNDENFSGIYNKEKTKFFLIKSIARNIDKESTSSNIVDLSKFNEGYSYEDFLKIEQYAKQFFTKYHEGHLWLTNLGKTRIEMFIGKSSKMGVFDIDKGSKELGIPSSIIKSFIKGIFTKKNGFWNQERTVFYYSKYIKKEISQIQQTSDIEERQKKIVHLSEELNIEKEEISLKVDEKLHKLGQILANKDEINIKRQLSDLQMDYDEFMEFIASLNKSYLIIRGNVIFNESRIKKEKEYIKKKLIDTSSRSKLIDVNIFSSRNNCASNITLELLSEIVEEEKIKGIWLDENKYLPEYGIVGRILDNRSFIDLHTLITERTITPNEVEYLESILMDLMEENRLKGIYDENHHIFTAEDMAGKVTLEEEKERFIKEFQPYLDNLEYKYNFLQEILMTPSPRPADIDQYQNLVDEAVELAFGIESILKRLLNNANRKIKNKMGLKNRGNQRKGRKSKSRSSQEEEDEIARFEDEEEIKSLIEQYELWKQLIVAVEQTAGKIQFLQVKIKNRPDDEESKKKLNDLFEYLGFID